MHLYSTTAGYKGVPLLLVALYCKQSTVGGQCITLLLVNDDKNNTSSRCVISSNRIMFEDFNKSHIFRGSIIWEKCKNLNCSIFSVDLWWDSNN